MTINSLDANEIARKTADMYRNLMQQRYVDISGEDYEAVTNFLTDTLSKYVDNKHIQNKQVNPHTGKAEEIEISGTHQGAI